MWDSASVYGMKSCITYTPQLGDFDTLLLKRVDSSKCKK